MSDSSRVRVSIVGVVVVALFSALLARLWFLQMGPEQSLAHEVVVHATRVVHTEMPRGEILDATGTRLVQDRTEWALTVDRSLRTRTRQRVLGQLAELLGGGVTEQQLEARYDDKRQSPLKPAIVALDVAEPVRVAVREHVDDYPGVHVEQLTVREYPHGQLAAQVLGYVGEISSDELARRKHQGYQPGDEIGRAGVEAAYEQDLRGDPRRETVEIDPTGRQVGPPVSVQPGAIGHNVVLTVHADWQAAAEQSLAQGIAAARTLQNKNVTNGYARLPAPAGSVVVMNVDDGSIAAMASSPSYDPTVWIGGISTADYARLTSPFGFDPLLDRATQGIYAPGSTFKLVTALALTRAGVRTPGTPYRDIGYAQVGRDRKFYNDNKEVLGTLDLQRAITESSNAYFASAGAALWGIWRSGDRQRGLTEQSVARELGFGSSTGIEIGDAPGRVPDPTWKQQFANANYKTEADRQDYGGWYPGDQANMAIGQGDMVVTPLQLADAYAAFANGGTLWRPHVAAAVTTVDGTPVRAIAPQAIRRIAIDPYVRDRMLAGFQGVVRDPRGTASAAFQGFPFSQVSVAGKTGTAQVNAGDTKGPTSLFVGMFSAQGQRYVVVAVVEQGGYGAQTAAPVARRIVEAMNGLQAADVQVNQTGHD